MANPYFRFKQFTVYHDRTAMKVTTDACLFGAWCAAILNKKQYPVRNILEIGTGTGLLSLMIAQQNTVMIDSVEIDASAAEQASENIANSSWNNNIRIHHCDILQFKSDQQYDCIISNPPFYEHEIESLSNKKNLAHHGAGLKLEDLFEIINNFLKPDGFFFLLLPYKRITEIEKLFKIKQFSILRKTIVQQSVLHQPFRLMLLGTNKKQAISPEEDGISIWSEQRQYTPEFVELLKDYYLYL